MVLLLFEWAVPFSGHVGEHSSSWKFQHVLPLVVQNEVVELLYLVLPFY